MGKTCPLMFQYNFVKRFGTINTALSLKDNIELQDLYTGGVVCITETRRVETRPKISRDKITSFDKWSDASLLVETWPKISRNKITSFDKWSDASLIFPSIYIKRYPSKCQELLQYISIIRQAASRSSSLSWRTYD